jgi:hypothetical protein
MTAVTSAKRSAAALILTAVSVIASHAAAQSGRDVRVPVPAGASISGVVINDEERPQPVRRAIVTLTGPDLVPSRGATTDDDGRFVFTNLPAGRFTLTVTRAAFVTSAYGAKRPGRPGTPLVVTDRATITGLVVRLWRGAVITGIVRNEAGEPVPNLSVTAVPSRPRAAGGLLTLTNNGVTTNEAGVYRIFGLEPGQYLVMTRPSSQGGRPLMAMTDAQVDTALDALRRLASGQPGRGAPSPPSRPFTWAPVYFPGTADIDRAVPLTLKAGEERAGVDIGLQRVPAAIVTGMVARLDATPAVGATVQLVRVPGPFRTGVPEVLTVRAAADGSFQISQVTPGDYRLIARASAAPLVPPTAGTDPPPANEAPLWAKQDLTVAGQDISGITLSAGPGLTITGRIAFASSATSAPPAPSLRGTRVALVAPWLANLKPGTPIDALGFAAGAFVMDDGTFQITGLLPGRYKLQITGSAIGAPWTVRSAMLDDRDLADAATDFTNMPTTGSLLITYTDRRSALSGTLQQASGAPSSDVFVIAYTTDRRLWTQSSRRVQAVRPDVAGRYFFGDLPPGEYHLAVVTDIDADEWLEPGFLERLLGSSLRVTIGEGEQHHQSLRIGGY